MNFTIWPEKYRPSSFDDMILNNEFKGNFVKYINECAPNNLIFSGTPGIGKSSSARIILNSLKNKIDILWLNSSDSRGVAFVKDQIKLFITTKSFFQRKVVFIDEGERLTPEAFDALKDLTENYWRNASFIIVTNFLYKIPDSIKSRFIIYEFKKPKKEDAIKYYEKILKSENIDYEDKDLETVFKKSNGDIRKSLNILKRNIINNKLILKNDNYESILIFIKNNDLKGIKKYLAENYVDYDEMYRVLYERISSVDGIIIIGKYLYQHSIVIDAEINFVCCIADLIKLMKLKKR